MASLNSKLLLQPQSISQNFSSTSRTPKPHFIYNYSSAHYNLGCSSSSSCSSSPFTEKHSRERYERENWVHPLPLSLTNSHLNPDPSSNFEGSNIENNHERENDIALQLPELKKLLQVLKEKRDETSSSSSSLGSVCLVGTGPGDPELLTIKALRAIKSADLLLYDRLVSHDVLDLVSPNARLLYVGKTAGYHSRTQEEIHELLLSFAEAGANVVRLKGGDPLVSFY